MKSFASYALALLAGLMLAGCQTPGGGVSPETRSAQSAARRYQKELEQRLSSHVAAQASIGKQADQLHADLLDAAKEMRGIKEQANLVSSAALTNAAALETLKYDIAKQRGQLEELEKKAQAEREKVKALQDALSKEQSVRQQEAAALRAESVRAAAEEQKKTEEVKAALAREQELRTREQAALKEREKEVAGLRKSLEERDQLLRVQPVPVPAPAPAPAGVVAPKAPEAPAARQVAEGNVALRKGQLEEAEKLFNAALIATPGMMGARVGLAACRYEKGDLVEARKLVAQVLLEDRRNVQALGLMGLVHWRSGELDDAEDVLEDAIKQDKQDSQLRNYLGIVLYERKKSDAAVTSLRKAVELDPANAEARYNLSVVLAMSPHPQLDEARVQYDKAVELGSARDEAMEKLLGPAKAAAPKS